MDALQTNARQQIGHEEGQPAGNEDAHHDAQCLGSLALLGYFGQFAAQREIHLGHWHRPDDSWRSHQGDAISRGRQQRAAARSAAAGARPDGWNVSRFNDAITDDGHAAGHALAVDLDANGADTRQTFVAAAQRRGHLRSGAQLSVAVGAGGGSRAATSAAVDPQSELHFAVAALGRDLFHAEPQGSRLGDGGAVNAVVGEDHDQQRPVERDGRREHQVADIVGEETLVDGRIGRRLRSDGPPPGDGRERDQTGTEPNQRDETAGPSGRHSTRIGERVRDGPVAIHGNDAQVQNGRRAGQDVERVPHVAQVLTEHPLAVQQFVSCTERHDDGTDQTVGHGQWRDEVVGDGVQVTFSGHGHHHQDVAEDGGSTKGEQDHGQRHVLQCNIAQGWQVSVAALIGQRDVPWFGGRWHGVVTATLIGAQETRRRFMCRIGNGRHVLSSLCVTVSW